MAGVGVPGGAGVGGTGDGAQAEAKATVKAATTAKLRIGLACIGTGESSPVRAEASLAGGKGAYFSRSLISTDSASTTSLSSTGRLPAVSARRCSRTTSGGHSSINM